MSSLFEETKYILKKYGITANKSLGQNFLINEDAVEKIVEGASISKEDLVIEIGPGLGTLTKELLDKAGKVIAIELDKRMLEILTDRFNLYDNFELINEDVLKVDLKELIDKNLEVEQLKSAKIVANLPYYITTPIVMKLLEENLPIESITIMIQKEVADRITSEPGSKDYGVLTINTNYQADVEKLFNVPNTSFIPAPNVTSAVIKIMPSIEKEQELEIKDYGLNIKNTKATFIVAFVFFHILYLPF